MMATPTPELMRSPWYQKLVQEAMSRPDLAMRVFGDSLRLPAVPACYPKDRCFKACECRHFVDFCNHIWQDDPRNIKFQLRRGKLPPLPEELAVTTFTLGYQLKSQGGQGGQR